MARVILRRCDDYDPDRIKHLIGECMDELGLRPQGITMVKPNCVIAHPTFFPHAFTRSEFLDGLLGALRERDDAVSDLWVGERCGITIPTRFSFSNALYPKVIKRHAAKTKYFDEMSQVQRNLFSEGRLRDYIFIPEAVDACEWFVDAPKFKAHPWTKVTFNLKNYIGIQDDEHRLIDHDHHLHTKIADLFEVVQPKLCAVDGITAGAKTMLTPRPFPLGLIVVGDNAVATDVVCTAIAGLSASEVDHIRITAQRGWGPLSLDEIQISGDVDLEEAKHRAKGFELTLDKVDKIYNQKSKLQVYMGPPPDTYDYCWGGCPGALDEAIGIVERVQPQARHEMKPLHIVYGDYKGKIEPKADEKVIFIGDCARYQGKIAGEETEIPFLYKERATIYPERVKPADIVKKIVLYLWYKIISGRKRVWRVQGCPVSVAENVLLVSDLGKTKNPYLKPSIGLQFIWFYCVSKLMRLLFRRNVPQKSTLKRTG